MESRVKAVLERGHRGWGCQDLHGGSWWFVERWSPSVECEGFEMSIENQVWFAGLRVEDDRSDRQGVEIAALKTVLKGILLIFFLIRSFGLKSVTGPLFNMKYELVSCYIG